MPRHFAVLGPLLATAWAGLAFGQAPAPAAPVAPASSASQSAPAPPSAGSAAPATAEAPSAAPASTVAPAAAPPEEAKPGEDPGMLVADSPQPVAPPVRTPIESQARTQAAAPSRLSPIKTDEEPEQDRARRELGPDPWRDGHAFALEGIVGMAARFGSLNDGFGTEENIDTTFQLGGYFALSSVWALGLELERTGLGRASATSGVNSISAEYDVTGLWLSGRVFPFRSERAEIFLGLRLGLGWQSFDAVGTRDQLPTTASPLTFSCSATEGPGFGLGATLGGAYRLGTNVSLVARVDGSGRQLSSDVIDGCAVGAGSITGVSVGGGLLYAFDLGKNASLSARGAAGGSASY